MITEPLYKVYNTAANFFYMNLREKPEGKTAYLYIRNRGVSELSCDIFALGYASSEQSSLYNYLKSQNIPDCLIKESGLSYPSKYGGWFDFFQDRLIFPVMNECSDVIAFGGRRMSDDSKDPKYINSRESSIYKKQNVLYGYNYAKNAIESEGYTIIVEGYVDLIANHQEGIKNVVATSGTAFSEFQINTLKQHSKYFVLVYDPDHAGVSAAIRCISPLLLNNLKAGMVLLPDGKDPASFIFSESRYSFMKMILKRMSFVEFIITVYKQNNKFTSPDDKTECVNSILDLISLCSDYKTVSFYSNELSKLADLSFNLISKEVSKRKNERAPRNNN